VYEKGGCRARL
jgi:uncharacterized protein YjbJ (UPF0337 family)